MLGKFLHTRLITEDRTFGALTGGIDGKNGQTTSFLTEYVHAELIDRGGLASTWNRQTLVDDLLGTGLMVGVDTLDKGDSLREHGDIALKDAFHHLCR